MEIVVLITCPNKKEAAKISAGLVGKKLAACVNMVSSVISVFTWKGKTERCREVLLIAKSTRGRFRALEKFVKSSHSYEVPEVIALPVVAGNADYLEWLNAAVR